MGIYSWTKMILQYLELWQSQAHVWAASWTTAQSSLVHVPGVTFRSQGVTSKSLFPFPEKAHFCHQDIKKHEITQRFLAHVLDPNCLNLLLMATKQYTWPEQSKGCVSNLHFAVPHLYEPYSAVPEHLYHTEPQTQHEEALKTIPTAELAAKTPGQRCALLCITQDSVTSVGTLRDKQLTIKLMLGNEHTEYITTLFYPWILNAHSHNDKSLEQNKATFMAEVPQLSRTCCCLSESASGGDGWYKTGHQGIWRGT